MTLRATLAAAIIVVLAGSSNAQRSSEPELVLASGRSRIARAVTTVVPPAARAAAAPLVAAGWSMSWDADTGVPLRLWGGTVAAPGSTRDPANAERIAREVLARHVALLAPGARAGDFELVANQLDGDLRTVGFRQRWNGLPVIGGQLSFVFGHDRLFVIGSEALPHVHADLPRDRASDATLRRRAERWVASATGAGAGASPNGRVVLPMINPGGVTYHIVEVLDVTSGHERWDVYVAPDGTPIARRSRIRHASATLAYDAGVRYPGGTRTPYPAPAAAITVDGASTATGADGSFSWAGAANASVAPSTTGATVRVHNTAGTSVASLPASPGAQVLWSLATSEFGDAELTTYIHGNLAKARGRLINPSVVPWLDQQLDFFVNDNDTCNAFSTGDDVHFFRASSMCENTGRLADVVYHEFGHSLHFQSVIPGAGAWEASLSEGLADFNSANITEDPGIGVGFLLTTAPLRELEPDRRWPADISPDPHETGLIIGGALWDLRKALIAELGHDAGVTATERVFRGILQRAADIPSAFVAALTADDDDGNLGNGTPHQCAIGRAFVAHGLGDVLAETQLGSPTFEGTAVHVAVVRPPSTCAQDVTAMTVTWRDDTGSTHDFDLALAEGRWTGAFPASVGGTLIQYAVRATLDDGSSRVLPDNPADPMYQRWFATPKIVWCEPFNVRPGWMKGGNQGAGWEFGVPTGLSGDPTAAASGNFVFGNDLTQDGQYGAGEVTSLETPAYDLRGYRTLRLQYQRWLAVEDSQLDVAAIEVKHGAAVTRIWTNATGNNGTLRHTDKEWRFHDLDLAPYVADGPVALRWTLDADLGGQYGGWNLDDVCVVTFDANHCGDGVVEAHEACDDGNRDDGDGCAATCELEADTGCCSAGANPTGPVSLGLGLALWLHRRRRRVPSSSR